MNIETVQKLVFLDTETISLRPDRRAWEVAWIVRDLTANTQSDPVRRFVDIDDLDLGNADPFSLAIGRFYGRHPQVRAPLDRRCYTDSHQNDDAWGDLSGEHAMLREVEHVTRGAHLVGALPSFDAEVLGARMRARGIAPSWHYHLIDVGALAVGRISGWHTAGDPPLVPLPWNSDDLSRLLSVEPAPPELRHTAAGDADWAMRLFDAATAGAYALRPQDATVPDGE